MRGAARAACSMTWLSVRVLDAGAADAVAEGDAYWGGSSDRRATSSRAIDEYFLRSLTAREGHRARADLDAAVRTRPLLARAAIRAFGVRLANDATSASSYAAISSQGTYCLAIPDIAVGYYNEREDHAPLRRGSRRHAVAARDACEAKGKGDVCPFAQSHADRLRGWLETAAIKRREFPPVSPSRWVSKRYQTQRL
jgi:hypothetical protein